MGRGSHHPLCAILLLILLLPTTSALSWSDGIQAEFSSPVGFLDFDEPVALQGACEGILYRQQGISVLAFGGYQEPVSERLGVEDPLISPRGEGHILLADVRPSNTLRLESVDLQTPAGAPNYMGLSTWDFKGKGTFLAHTAPGTSIVSANRAAIWGATFEDQSGQVVQTGESSYVGATGAGYAKRQLADLACPFDLESTGDLTLGLEEIFLNGKGTIYMEDGALIDRIGSRTLEGRVSLHLRATEDGYELVDWSEQALVVDRIRESAPWTLAGLAMIGLLMLGIAFESAPAAKRLMEKGNLHLAIALARLRKLSKQGPQATITLASSYMQLGKFARARTILETTPENLRPNLAVYELMLADACIHSDDEPACRQHLQAMLAVDRRMAQVAVDQEPRLGPLLDDLLGRTPSVRELL